jgi:hypothetical protein
VEDGGDAEVTAEVARIAAEAGERGGGGLKEEPIDQVGVALGQRVERVGQREDDVEVRDGEQVGAPGLEPVLLGEGLALRAVAVGQEW